MAPFRVRFMSPNQSVDTEELTRLLVIFVSVMQWIDSAIRDCGNSFPGDRREFTALRSAIHEFNHLPRLRSNSEDEITHYVVALAGNNEKAALRRLVRLIPWDHNLPLVYTIQRVGLYPPFAQSMQRLLVCL